MFSSFLSKFKKDPAKPSQPQEAAERPLATPAASTASAPLPAASAGPAQPQPLPQQPVTVSAGQPQQQSPHAAPTTPTPGLALSRAFKEQMEVLRTRREALSSQASLATQNLSLAEVQTRATFDSWRSFNTEVAKIPAMTATVGAMREQAERLLGKLAELEDALTAQTEAAEQRARDAYAARLRDATETHRIDCERRLERLRAQLNNTLARVRADAEAERRRREREAAALEESVRKSAEAAFASAVNKDLDSWRTRGLVAVAQEPPQEGPHEHAGAQGMPTPVSTPVHHAQQDDAEAVLAQHVAPPKSPLALERFLAAADGKSPVDAVAQSDEGETPAEGTSPEPAVAVEVLKDVEVLPE